MATETPPPDAARHPDQYQSVSHDDHTLREQEQYLLAGGSRSIDEPNRCIVPDQPLQYP